MTRAGVYIRHFSSPLELRDAGNGDGRTVFGRIVPYGEVITFRDNDGALKRERFAEGSLTDDARAWHRVLLSFEHHEMPGFANTIGYGVQNSVEERNEGAYASFRLYKQDAEKGREALTTSHRGLSLEFYPLSSSVDQDGVIVRNKVKVVRVAAVVDPAYLGAEVIGVRQADPSIVEEIPRGATPNLDAARAILAELRRSA